MSDIKVTYDEHYGLALISSAAGFTQIHMSRTGAEALALVVGASFELGPDGPLGPPDQQPDNYNPTGQVRE